MLGFFGPEMEFQENIHHTMIGDGPSLYGFQQVQGVHRLDQRNVRQYQLQLIGLEMTDEMPLDIGRHQGHLGCQLLRTVFAEDTLPGVIGLHEALDGMEFRNSHQSNP